MTNDEAGAIFAEIEREHELGEGLLQIARKGGNTLIYWPPVAISAYTQNGIRSRALAKCPSGWAIHVKRIPYPDEDIEVDAHAVDRYHASQVALRQMSERAAARKAEEQARAAAQALDGLEKLDEILGAIDAHMEA
jgi:hypothetical protein